MVNAPGGKVYQPVCHRGRSQAHSSSLFQELLNLLLFGNDAFNENLNESVFLATISYIITTNGFI